MRGGSLVVLRLCPTTGPAHLRLRRVQARTRGKYKAIREMAVDSSWATNYCEALARFFRSSVLVVSVHIPFAFPRDASTPSTTSSRPSWRSVWGLVLLLGLVVAVASGCGGSREARTAPPAADSTLAPAALKQDLDALRNTIQKVHPAFADSTARTESFRHAEQSQRANLDRPMTPCAFHRRVAPLVTALDDGHTGLGFGRCFESFAETRSTFPFDVALTDSTAVVLRSYQDEAPVSPGTHIVAVDTTSVSTLHDQFLKRVSGALPVFRRQQLEGQSDTFKFFLWHVSGIEAPFNLTVRNGDEERLVEVDGVPADTIRARRTDDNSPPYAYRSLDDRAGLLTVRSFGAPEDDFDDFLDSTFDQIRRAGTEHLLIDVRDNAGGQSGRADDLLRYLASSPFALIDTFAVRASETFKSHMKQTRLPAVLRWLPVQYLDGRGRAIWEAREGTVVSWPGERVSPHDADERFDGRVSVLVNEGTFSTATLFAAAVKELEIGTLVGRETGGPAGVTFGERVPTRLPNSGLWILVASTRIQFGEKPPGWPSRGVAPDHRVPRDLQAKVRGGDPILERAQSRLDD